MCEQVGILYKDGTYQLIEVPEDWTVEQTLDYLGVEEDGEK